MGRTRYRGAIAACVLAAALPASALAADRTIPAAAGAASEGDLRFHARPTAFRHAAGENRAAFAIRIPYSELKFVRRADSLHEAHLRVTVEMWDRAEKRAGYKQQEARVQVTDPAAGADSLVGEIYTVGIPVKPGAYRYRVLVEDMNVARIGLVYKLKNQKRQGKVEGSIDLGAWLTRNPALSGIETAWEITAADEGATFRKGPYEVYPQPSGHYGRYQDVVAAYYEIYDDPPPPSGRRYIVSSFVVGADGDTLLPGVDTLRVSEGTAWPHVLMLDAATFPAGHYRLVLTLAREGEPAAATSQTEFDILWSEDSWRPDAFEFYEVTAAALLSSEEALSFRSLPMGSKEVRIERAWREADPTPETAENERRLEFARRVAYANARYTVFGRGMFSDRGRVYIRFGEPDDVKIERLPVAGKTLGHAIGNTIPQQSKETLIKSGSGVADFRPYEIWTYDLRGNELSPRFGAHEVTSGMKFVFVDEQGYGDYTLRYSSTSGVH